MNLFEPLKSKGEDKKNDNENVVAEHVKVLIIGSGPAGYTAAIYAARANLNPVLYEGLQPGGQLTTTTEVDNFPGYPEGVTGPAMMEDLKKQAERFGSQIRFGMATSADLSQKPYKVTIDGEKTISADALIIATGATAKYLGLESEEKYKGQGVSACATCDGFFYKGQSVAVVGGGDTACEEATYLSGICKKVYMIVRKPYLRASKAMQDRVDSNENIEVLYEHTTKEIVGDMSGVNGVVLTNSKNEEVKIDVTGFFVAIGHKPNSDIFKDYLDLDETGYIKTIPGTPKTNIEGVFACGDVQDKHYRQAVTAAGTGCMAALDAERYLGTRVF
ncbi:MAG TPA: thioredoxin-disulfide reductase [Perlabentimonas sp.]|nr:thioredoxin-disulfide reductase [Bacteroidales bacterium]MDD4672100.1 thioredoxin-disulfide reductase [Bacteroidales bacterium]MDY0348978.1 thioredoxin-disulfide reductase [Tenuifilaceae bacterium]HZJ73174.1 thioredoxin-disulfide reductase [Perlabentimonas sp.]